MFAQMPPGMPIEQAILGTQLLPPGICYEWPSAGRARLREQ